MPASRRISIGRLFIFWTQTDNKNLRVIYLETLLECDKINSSYEFKNAA